MPLRLQRILSAFALSATVATFAFSASLVYLSAAGPEPAFAATFELAAQPEGRERASSPPPTTGERAAKIALRAIGVPYRWGGESPASGFDCSGLVRWAYGHVGIDLPHNSYALYSEGRMVSEARMEPGDVLFFSGLGHVGLYLGRGRMVHAPQTGRHVEVVGLGQSHYGQRLVGARRVAS
jgi:cell wall-associated NlpC family hydrolase